MDLEQFPFNIWRKINRQVLSEEHTDLFLLEIPGESGLREAIARYHQARGVKCTTEQIVIGAGERLSADASVPHIGNGTAGGDEDPTYRQAYCVFENLGYSMHRGNGRHGNDGGRT